jgi:hypothetical protein
LEYSFSSILLVRGAPYQAGPKGAIVPPGRYFAGRVSRRNGCHPKSTSVAVDDRYHRCDKDHPQPKNERIRKQTSDSRFSMIGRINAEPAVAGL